MLPDWPETKEMIGEAFVRFIRAEVDARSGMLAEVKQSVVHEGDGMTISRADGSVSDEGFQSIGSHLEITVDEFAGMPIPVVLGKLQRLAEDIAQKRSEYAFSAINAACEETGNVVDAKGGQLTAELVLETWDKMEIAFSDDGQPQLPTIVFNPQNGTAIAEALSRLESDPNLKQQAAEIIQRKREQWFARETDRTLAG